MSHRTPTVWVDTDGHITGSPETLTDETLNKLDIKDPTVVSNNAGTIEAGLSKTYPILADQNNDFQLFW